MSISLHFWTFYHVQITDETVVPNALLLLREQSVERKRARTVFKEILFPSHASFFFVGSVLSSPQNRSEPKRHRKGLEYKRRITPEARLARYCWFVLVWPLHHGCWGDGHGLFFFFSAVSSVSPSTNREENWETKIWIRNLG